MLRYLLDGCSLSTNSAVHRAAVAILMGDGNPAPATGLRQLLALFVESGIHNTGRYRHSPKTTYDVSTRTRRGVLVFHPRIPPV